MNENRRQFIESLKRQNVAAFREVVVEYGESLNIKAGNRLGDPQRGKEIVDDFLLDLYNRKFEGIYEPVYCFLHEKLDGWIIAEQTKPKTIIRLPKP